MLNKALLASPKEFRISIGTQTHCSVQLSKASAMPGDKITITVNPATGYGNTTVGISTNGSVTKVNNTTFTFIMPFTDVVVNASASVLSFRINVNKQGSGNVNVKSVANYGETVTITLAPSYGQGIKSVSVPGVSVSGEGNTRTFVMPAKDITISVVFNLLYHFKVTPSLGIGNREKNISAWAKPGQMDRVPYYINKTFYIESIGDTYSKVAGTFKHSHMQASLQTSNSLSIKVNNVPFSTSGSSWKTLFNSSSKLFPEGENKTYNIILDPPPLGYLDVNTLT